MMGLLGTKSFWVGLAAIFTAIGMGIGGQMSWAEVIQTCVLGVATITGRHAIAKVQR